MTAVAPPQNFQQISRPPYGSSNGIMGDEGSRMFMPRRPIQRTPSASSVSSSASTGTLTTTSGAPNGINSSPATDGQWATKKKPTRGLWPASEAKPVAGLSTARPQPIASATSGPSAASAISALHSPSAMLPSQQSHTQQNGQPRSSLQPENTAVLYLSPMNGTFDRKTITVPFFPDVLKIGRQTNAKTSPTPLNGYFDSKVLSRSHAEVWADRTGKIYIRDVKSSNGTFVNGDRLSQENRDSEPRELREQDMLELGIDIVSEDQKTIVHHKVAARVEHAGFYNIANIPNSQNPLELNFGDLDSPSATGLLGNGYGPNLGPMRSRQGSQGSIGNGRLGSVPGSVAGSNMGAVGQQRHNTFWLSPVTMEQVVKRLNSELKLAKQQTQELQRASQSIETLLTTDPKKESSKSPRSAQNSMMKPSPVKGDLKARFSDPPAPPPQQPLPEKPDAANYLPALRRNDTEKPKSLNGSPLPSDGAGMFSTIDSLADPQKAALAEALATAKKDLEAQNIKLKELEQILEQEKRAREAAEEKAHRLEAEHGKDDTPPANENIDRSSDCLAVEDMLDDETLVDSQSEKASLGSSPTDSHNPADALQQRMESMVAEMSEMRQQMEKFRQRAAKAEAESEQSRVTLAEMIEKMRDENLKKGSKLTKRTRKQPAEPTEKSIDAESNGHIAREPSAHELEKTDALAQEFTEVFQQMLAQRREPGDMTGHKAPVASMVSIVLLGVGIMAWLNSWPKIER